MPSVRVNRVVALLGVFVLCVGLAGFLWWTWNAAKASRATSEITLLFALIEIGMTTEEVEQAYAGSPPQDVRLQKLNNGSWLFQTPLQWGAVNWVMWVDFSDGAVSAVRMRLLDDAERRPSEAPRDKREEGATNMGAGMQGSLRE
jgi:hypothetical protein